MPRLCRVQYRFQSELSTQLQNLIKTIGPISVAQYMKQCLTGPHGYYTTRDPFGVTGDFVTNAEISQIFGELVAVCLVGYWMSLERRKIRLVELGPGRGTLLDDMLRTSMQFQDFSSSIARVDLLEASPVLKEQQQTLLKKYEGKFEFHWHEDTTFLDQDKDLATYLIAHEFFDAMPIYKFENTEKGWRELLVDNISNMSSSSNSTLEKGMTEPKANFQLVRAPNPTPPSTLLLPSMMEIDNRFKNLPLLSRVEISPDSITLVKQITDALQNDNGGLALIMDYGTLDTIPVDTLRGIKTHKLVSPFACPGRVDLSADVDFAGLRIMSQDHSSKSSRHSFCSSPVTQADFLKHMGIELRRDLLMAYTESEEAKIRIDSGYKRLIDTGINGMGKIYKVLAITGHDVPVPGFS